jgi:hypothetical protein
MEEEEEKFGAELAKRDQPPRSLAPKCPNRVSSGPWPIITGSLSRATIKFREEQCPPGRMRSANGTNRKAIPSKHPHMLAIRFYEPLYAEMER